VAALLEATTFLSVSETALGFVASSCKMTFTPFPLLFEKMLSLTVKMTVPVPRR
jgi:hypothetical protein